MDEITLILFGGVILTLGVQTWFLVRKQKKEEQPKNDAAMAMLQQQLNQVSQTLDQKLAESNRAMQEQFGQSFKVIRDVTQKLTELDNTNKQVAGFAGQLQSLENILKNPKQRGILGEYLLKTVLENALPPKTWQEQYPLKNGAVVVDAAIFLKDKIVPIDSKFSLENYNKIVNEKDENRKKELEKLFKMDLKNRIDETAKYILPNEGTMDFAFMFIPAEGIYYDLLINEVGSVKINTRDLIEYAVHQKRVFIVSPLTLFAYLQSVIHGMQAMKIEESAKEILKNVLKLDNHLKSYQECMTKLGMHLGTAVGAYNNARVEYRKIDKDILKITNEEREQLKAPEIEKPTPEN